jgi:hypothetical protein
VAFGVARNFFAKYSEETLHSSRRSIVIVHHNVFCSFYISFPGADRGSLHAFCTTI